MAAHSNNVRQPFRHTQRHAEAHAAWCVLLVVTLSLNWKALRLASPHGNHAIRLSPSQGQPQFNP